MRARRQGLARVLLALALLCAAVAILVAVLGGATVRLGPLVLRSHNPVRPLVLSLVLFSAGYAAARRATTHALAWLWADIQRFAPVLALAVAAAAVWAGFRLGAFVAGGSDSYCYLNQAELLARGRVVDYEPLAADLSWPGTFWSFVPAGHMPRGEPVPLLVPICPSGYPLIMAGVRRLSGTREAMFWVTPVMGGIAVLCAFAIGRRIAGASAGLLSAVLVAVSPTFLYQQFQPMNDVTAAALWAAAIVALFRATAKPAAPATLLAGLATAAALTVRPNLVPLAGAVAAGVLLLPRGVGFRTRVWHSAVFAVGAAAGPVVVMLMQQAMYGSPLRSGYGDLDQLFAWRHVLPNLRRYSWWTVEAHTPVVLAAAAAPFVAARYGSRRESAWLLGFAAVTLACYLPYVVFDAWWYTRFLLPGLLPLLALTAASVAHTINALPAAWRAGAFTITAAGLVSISLHIGLRHDVFRIRDLEWRFRSAGEYAATLPADAAFVTVHHSGSLRFYTGRSTVGWADIEPGRLGEALLFLRRHGRQPYLVLEPWEEPAFKARFRGEPLGGLDWPAAADVDGVRIYDPEDRARHLRGDRIETRRLGDR